MAETLTGLVVGHAVIIYNGVEVALNVILAVDVGKAVTTKRGVLVAEGAILTVVELVMVGVADKLKVVVAVPVVVPVVVPVAVEEVVAVLVIVMVGVAVGGRAVGETDAASFPTVMSRPQT